MTSLPEQFSAAAGQSQANVKAQFEAQFDFFNKFANQALENASRVVNLNLAVSRDSVERSTRAALALAASRDLLALRSHAEEQVRSLVDYSRELVGIASGIKLYAPVLDAPALQQQLAAPFLKTVEAVVDAPVPAVKVAEADVVVAAQPEPVAAAKEVEPEPEPDPAPVAAAAQAEPVVVAEQEPAPETQALAVEAAPVAEPTILATAVGNGDAQAGVAPQPLSAPMPTETAEVRVPKLASGSRRKK